MMQGVKDIVQQCGWNLNFYMILITGMMDGCLFLIFFLFNFH